MPATPASLVLGAALVALVGVWLVAAFWLSRRLHGPQAPAQRRLEAQLLALGANAKAMASATTLPWQGAARCDVQGGPRPLGVLWSTGVRAVPARTMIFAAVGRSTSRAGNAPRPELSLVCRSHQVPGMSWSLGPSVVSGDAAIDAAFFLHIGIEMQSASARHFQGRFELPSALREAVLAYGLDCTFGIGKGYMMLSWDGWSVTRERLAAADAIFSACEQDATQLLRALDDTLS